MPQGDLFTAVMAIPGADRAVDFLQAQSAAFAYIPTRIDRVRRKLEAIRVAAAQRNDVLKVAKAGAALTGLNKLQSYYATTSGKVSEVLNALRTGSAGGVGAVVPKLLAVAAQVPLVFRSVDLFEQAASSLERGTLTPEEVARLERGGYTVRTAIVNPVVTVGLIMFGVWLLGRMLKGR